jgi:hypothetical protein
LIKEYPKSPPAGFAFAKPAFFAEKPEILRLQSKSLGCVT